MGDIVLFGATGYTGRLTAEALVARGLRPVLAARSAAKLEAVATALGGLETRVADVSRLETVRSLVTGGDVLVSTVGPFARFGGPAIEAAIEAGAAYLDSTGEPAFVRRVFETHDGPARARGVPLLTAFGADYVPGHTAAGVALSEAGEEATRVDVGYYATGRARAAGDSVAMSEGTAASLAGALFEPGLLFREGRRHLAYGGRSMRRFDVRGKDRLAVAIPATEHLALPTSYPWLREVNVYLGWFGAASPALVAFGHVIAALARVPGFRGLMGRLAARKTSSGRGPSAESRAASGSHVVAITYDAGGRELTRVEMSGPNGYTYTAAILAWGAEVAWAGGVHGSGALGPLEAFGLDELVAGSAEAGLRRV